jgi:hypothetical protein
MGNDGKIRVKGIESTRYLVKGIKSYIPKRLANN